MEYTLYVLNPKAVGRKNMAVGHKAEYNALYGFYDPHRKLVAWILGESRALQLSSQKYNVFSPFFDNPLMNHTQFWEQLVNSWHIDSELIVFVASGVGLHQHLSCDKVPSSNQPYPRTKPHIWHRHNVCWF